VDPKVHIFVNAQPKSASTFIEGSLRLTLGCPQVRIVTRGLNHSVVLPKDLEDFLSHECATSHGHLAPTLYNLKILDFLGLNKFVLTVRDPRDTLVSWGHHLERSDAKENKWHHAMMIASGIHPADYYNHSWEKKLDILIEFFLPVIQEWLRGWINVLENDSRFDIKVVRYDDFLTDPNNAIGDILFWYGLKMKPDEIIFPDNSGPTMAGINLATGFRRGAIGSHLDELTGIQRKILEKKLDPEVYDQFGWEI